MKPGVLARLGENMVHSWAVILAGQVRPGSIATVAVGALGLCSSDVKGRAPLHVSAGPWTLRASARLFNIPRPFLSGSVSETFLSDIHGRKYILLHNPYLSGFPPSGKRKPEYSNRENLALEMDGSGPGGLESLKRNPGETRNPNSDVFKGSGDFGYRSSAPLTPDLLPYQK